MPYALLYHPLVTTDDLPAIPTNLQRRLEHAIQTRLTSEPGRYGKPLRASLQGYWKLRVGDYRVVYRLVGEEVWILVILHRKRVYEAAQERRGWSPREPRES